MPKLIDNIKKYPVIFYFLFTFIISWLLFIPYIFYPNLFTISLIFTAIYTPAYSALLITQLFGIKQKKKLPVISWIIFIIVWVAAALTFLKNYQINFLDISIEVIIISIILGLLPAFVILAGFSRKEETQKIFQSYIKPKGNFIFYLIAVLLLPCSHLIGIGITLLIGQSIEWISLPGGFELIGLIAFTFIYTFFYGAGTNEEPGWRGFALSKLQLKFSPLVASLILGLIWGLWHLPIYLPSYENPIQFLFFILNILKITIILTWLYNRTKGSVLATALLHTVGNISFEFLPTTLASDIIQILIMIIFVVTDKMWLKKKEIDSNKVGSNEEKSDDELLT